MGVSLVRDKLCHLIAAIAADPQKKSGSHGEKRIGMKEEGQ